MPPSGYPRRDAQTIAFFLSSCIDALEAERAMLEESPVEALSREIGGIDSVLSKYSEELFALHTLFLTRAFYARVRDYNPHSVSDLRNAASRVLDQVVSEIGGVHVDEHLLRPA